MARAVLRYTHSTNPASGLAPNSSSRNATPIRIVLMITTA